MFQSPVEYRVVSACRTLGTMPVDQPPIIDHMIVFAGRRHIISEADRVLLFPWVGSDKVTTLALALRDAGLEASADDMVVEIEDASPDGVTSVLRAMSAKPPPNSRSLAERVETKEREKFDPCLSDDLLVSQIARSLPVEAVPELCPRMLR